MTRTTRKTRKATDPDAEPVEKIGADGAPFAGDLGRKIITDLVDGSKDLGPWLSEGFTAEWHAARRQVPSVFFGNSDWLAYQLILDHWAKHQKVPTLSAFRRSFPRDSYPLTVRAERSIQAELIEAAHQEDDALIIYETADDLVHMNDARKIEAARECIFAAADRLRAGPSGYSNPERMVNVTGSSIEPEAAEWVWEPDGCGWLPRGFLVPVAGKGDAGKSMYCAWATAKLSRGELPGCWYGTPKATAWLTLESSLSIEIVPRLLANGADMELINFPHAELVTDPAIRHIKLFSSAHLDELRKLIREQDIGLLVLDPMIDVLDSRLNSKEQNEVRDALTVLGELAQEEGDIVLGIAHFNKMSSVTEAVDRLTGSAAFSQRPRAVVAVARNDEDENHVISLVKHNLGISQEPRAFTLEQRLVTTHPRPVHSVRICWQDGPAEYSVDDLLERRHKDNGQSKTAQCREMIETALLEGPKMKPEIQAAAYAEGFSSATLNRAWREVEGHHSRIPVPGGPAEWSIQRAEVNF